MILGLSLAALTALAAAFLAWPFVRRRPPAPPRPAYELEVYRAQLDELEREAGRGLLGPREAAAARLEVQRRILAADARRTAAEPRGGAAAHRWLALALAVAVPALSTGLYWRLGSPELAGQPFAARQEERRAVAAGGQAPSVATVESLIARLEERVAAQPDDAEAWLRLARAQELMQAPAAAARAYEEVLRRQDGPAEVHAALAEALILAAGGTVTERARAAVERALELDPEEPRARFYRGLALVQRGEREAGLAAWVDLLRASPADAPWRPVLTARVAALAEELGRDPAAVIPAPAERALATADALPQDEAALRLEAARLRAALAAAPRDWEGWIRLAQLHAALGEAAAAETALAEGAEVYAGAPFVQQQFVVAADDLGVTPPPADGAPAQPTGEQMAAAAQMAPAEREAMIRGMVEGLAARLREAPDDVEGWRMLVRSYRVLGQPEQAAEAAREVAERLPEDPAAQLDYARALLDRQAEGAPLGPDLVQQLERVAALDEDNPEALFFLGRAAAERGERASAEAYWGRLLAQIPEAAPERAQLERLIEGLAAGG